MREAAGDLLALEERLVGRKALRRPLGELLLLARAESDPSACATRDAMSDCTWKTSVSAASNGCCHFEVGASGCDTSTSSGLTCTRRVPPLVSDRTVAVRR